MKFLQFTLMTWLLCHAGFAQTFVKSKLKKQEALSSEAFQSMTFNGAWCWFSDPRAVYYEGEHKRTYVGWVDNYGDIQIGYYDHTTGEIDSRVLYDNLEIDDHNNPSVLFDEEGKLMVFFNNHMLGVKPLYIVRATEPESIESWEPVQELYLNDEKLSDLGSMNHTYTNPIKLSAEEGKMYLFWRGVDGKPSYSTSEDNGKTWATGKIFFMPERKYSFRRPYTKVYSDGVDKIHFTLTDGHPHREDANNIYYMYYQGGAFYKADGTKIKDLGGEPVLPEEADLVYDAAKGKARAWNWEIGETDGQPVIAYTKYPDEQNHIYCYARWDGKQWLNYDLINSGSWFPQTIEGVEEPEPNYSGGMSIDHESPGRLYLSVKRDSIFEIEQWDTKNGGKSWTVTPITDGSSKDNIRPFAVRNAGEGNKLQFLWMQNTKYHHFTYGDRMKDWGLEFKDRYQTAIQTSIPMNSVSNPLSKQGVVDMMQRAADWHLSNPRYKYDPIDWHYGALYTGVRALYEVTGEDRYRNELINIGQAAEWKPLDDFLHADRLTVIDNWAWLSGLMNDEEMIEKSRWALDIHIARGTKHTDVRFKDNPYKLEWWTWCDALFMAPPSFVEMWKLTGETKYLEYMDEQWWRTSDYLYSDVDSLYYRDDRYFDRLSDNGKKIFWARGNGWVIAGLARILEDLPADYSGREKLEKQYLEMAHKLLRIQGADGLWRVSLHDPEYLDMGESSGSSFFTFALAWGLNNDMIDQKYRPQVEKAWKALCNNVNEEGRLGYVQQVAGDPYPFKADESHVYATGAYLLAGKEMYKLADKP